MLKIFFVNNMSFAINIYLQNIIVESLNQISGSVLQGARAETK